MFFYVLMNDMFVTIALGITRSWVFPGLKIQFQVGLNFKQGNVILYM